jgi:hypothetical protein
MFYAKICLSKNLCPMRRMLVQDVAIPGWGFLVLMEAQGFHYLVPIYLYIYVHGGTKMHLGAFSILNAPRVQ